jgi:signal transduction histidine kinase
VLRRLRWLTIGLLVLFVVIVEVLSDTLLDEDLPFPVDTLVVALAVLVAGLVMTTVTFRAVDRLADELRQRNAELETRNASASALHAMSLAITALADLDQILAKTAENARTLLSADIAWVTRTGADGREWLAASSGPAEAFDPAGGQPGEDARRFVQPAFAGSYLEAPLQRAGTTTGVLAVAGRGTARHGVDDLETLHSLANQAAIAVENDRLQRELRGLAISAERERIAREMHDGLAQVLGYVNTKSQAVEELLSAGRTAEARSQMAELAAAARSIYVDVREAILSLSTPLVAAATSGSDGPVAGGADLVSAVRTYLERWGDTAKVAVSLDADPGIRYAPLSPELVANLLRVIQEALTNVRKHAAAGRVVIRLSSTPGGLGVVVEDDGRGFELLAPGRPTDWPHFGQETIRQRVAAIGGTVRWESAPGQGTRVRVDAPVS